MGVRDIANGSMAAGALLFGAMLAVAAPASADDADDEYLSALEAGGISVEDPAAAIAMGRTVCAGLDQGGSFPNIITMLGLSADLSSAEAGHVLGVSIIGYCPQHKAAMEQWSESVGSGWLAPSMPAPDLGW